jgi:hypothetical protein
MFEVHLLVAAACVAGLGILFYFLHIKKKNVDGEKQLVSAMYKVNSSIFAIIATKLSTLSSMLTFGYNQG